jgi:hypothetical protein
VVVELEYTVLGLMEQVVQLVLMHNRLERVGVEAVMEMLLTQLLLMLVAVYTEEV